MNILQHAREGTVTPEIEQIAQIEDESVEYILNGVAGGEIVILKNNKHQIEPVALGKGLATKINANIG